MAEILSYICPFCGHEVRVGKPCPDCARQGSNSKNSRTSRTSWEQDATHDGLDLPENDFDYDDFVAREFGQTPHRQNGLKWYWWLLGVAVLVGMILAVFFR